MDSYMRLIAVLIVGCRDVNVFLMSKLGVFISESYTKAPKYLKISLLLFVR